jgi:hypothetical protein
MRRLDGHGETAAKALAAIRLVNGASAMLAPGIVARRLGADPARAPGLTYALRMFGVRTVVVASDLVGRDPAVRRAAARTAVLIHATDVVAAATAGVRGELPRRTAVALTALSTMNTGLAVLVWRARRR